MKRSNKILFLDVDGVLNSHPWFMRMQDEPLPVGLDDAIAALQYAGCGRDLKTFTMMIDPGAVAHLNAIISATSAKVVISSTWRKGWTPEQMSIMLKLRGFIGEVIDRTPVHVPRKMSQNILRGHEIQEWLDNHPEVESFVILDDDSDMAHLRRFLVQTSTEHGLLEKHVKHAIMILET